MSTKHDEDVIRRLKAIESEVKSLRDSTNHVSSHCKKVEKIMKNCGGFIGFIEGVAGVMERTFPGMLEDITPEVIPPIEMLKPPSFSITSFVVKNAMFVIYPLCLYYAYAYYDLQLQYARCGCDARV